MVQNEKFAAAIDVGLAAANATVGQGVLEPVIALIRPVVECLREHTENGRTYLHELVFGDPAEPYRQAGLALAGRFEVGITGLLTRDAHIDAADAATLARVITTIIHISTTATLYLHRSDEALLADIRDQIQATLAPHRRAA